MKAAFYTLGCKVNQYETESLAEQFESAGFEIVSQDNEQVDVFVINSCTVTAAGDQKTRQMLHRFRRMHPEAIIAVTGCMPQASPEGIGNILPEANVITGSSNRRELLGAIQEAITTGERIIEIASHDKGEIFEPLVINSSGGHARAFLKIQDGCERYCAYCIIPKARGRLRSKPLKEVLKEAAALGEAGYQELVLVGINLSCYGVDNGSSLVEVVEEIEKIPSVKRIRLGSLEPELLTSEVMERLSKLSKFCPQFHLSLQSGSQGTLQRMRRHYTPDEYEEIVQNIHRFFENPSITTDLMVGFPGESEEEFLESQAFLEKIGFAKVHVFAYSRRPNTLADQMPNQLDKKTKQLRSQKMQKTAQKTREKFLEEQVGKECEVLFEEKKEDFWRGYSKNYTPVFVKSEEDLTKKVRLCNLTEISTALDGCVGILKIN